MICVFIDWLCCPLFWSTGWSSRWYQRPQEPASEAMGEDALVDQHKHLPVPHARGHRMEHFLS